MHPYQPWDEGIASTSPDLDDNDTRSFKIASWCDTNEMFIIPLRRPEPFGVCRAIKAHRNCKVDYQWFASENNKPSNPFYPMWLNPATGNTYASKCKRHTLHKPFTCTDTKTPITQKDIIFCGFDLTNDMLPNDLIVACGNHAAIWWKSHDKKRKRPSQGI